MTVKINRTAGKAPRPIVESLVGGQAFPLILLLTHKNDKPLVVPSSGINTPIEPGVETKVKIKSKDQAWMLVTDLSELAHRADSDAEDFAAFAAPSDDDLTPADPVPPVEPVTGEAGETPLKPVKKESK